MSVTRTIAKNTAFNFINSASDTLINLFVGILLARFLGPEEYGLYSFLVWFLYFLALFANFGLGHMVIRFIAEALGKQDEGQVKILTGTAFWIRLLITVLLATIVIAFSGFWADVFGHPGTGELFIILSIGLIPHVLNFLLTSIFAGFQKYEYGAYLMLATNPLRAVGILIVFALGLGVREVLFANIGAWLVGVFIGLFLLRRLIPVSNLFARPRHTPEAKRALKYSMIMMGVMLVNYFMNQRAEILFLELFHPGEAVAFYTVAYLVTGSTVGLILSVFSTVLVPAISEQVGRGNMDMVRSIYLTAARYLMIFGIPLAIGGITLAGPIIRLIYGVEYEPTIPLLQILFIPFAFMAIANSATSVILGINRPSFVLKVGAVLVALSIGLELWLIPTYGAVGAAIGSSVSRMIAPVLYITFASRECGASWPLKDTLKIGLSAIIMGAIVAVIEHQIESPIIAIVTLVPLGAIVHFSLILAFRILNLQDVDIIKHISGGLPTPLRRSIGAIIKPIETAIKKRGVSKATDIQ